jgi:predicted Fe-S protein YdhL (DUF1289 family)
MNSPCNKKCKLDDTKSYCVSCFRTLDEIREWVILTKEEREAILVSLLERRNGNWR